MKTWIGVVGILLAGGIARADLDADKARKDADEDLAKQLETTNQKCGTKLTAKYDWTSEKKSPPSQVGLGPGACREALKGVVEICEDVEGGKKAVKEKLKALSCKYNAKVTAKKSKGKGLATDLAGEPAVPHMWLELSKSTLHVEFDWSLANIQTEIAKYLRKEL